MKKPGELWGRLAGAAVARAGDEMSGPALLLAGLAVTGSAASASALLAGITVSAAVGGPILGVLLDRSARPGRLLAAALGGYSLALLTILAGLDRLPLPVTVLLAVGAGLLGPVLAGGWTSQLPRIVPPGELPRANALDAMTFNAAGLIGPALAGTVAQLAGAGTGVVLAAVLICLALPAALRLPPAEPHRLDQPQARGPERVITSVRTELIAGLRVIVRSRSLARATVVTVVSCAGEGMLVACAPLLGERVFGGAGQGALLLSGIAAAALAANALLARRPHRWRPDTLIGWSPLILAVALSLAATELPLLLIAAVALVGTAEGPQLTALFAIRHRESPERLRGQIFTTGASLKLTGFAVGAGAAGPLAARWSLTGALLTAAAVQLVAALCAAAWPRTDGGEADTARHRARGHAATGA
ncbi:MFS transporter [Streptomyces albipurpureus]|uniref:MFS transporter n=1 Tax=Streptomyces albipurpureus TaxID=2897419 RepID=A0ABT0UR08_9ACTN|nr:MFS transporter [Streptomyces sp. CWNU-1]MCM2390429.1 MFS transporter [Streptomyces sp. CWNU-1]